MRVYLICLLLTVSAGIPSALSAQSSGLRSPENASPPNIVLITLDTTRADRMGFLGSKRGLTPNLDQLAKQSVVFTRAYAQVPLTSPSHAALLTGTYPQFNHLRDLTNPLPDDVPYVPDLLHQHGYHTGAFIGAMILDPSSGAAPGFDRGFDVYDSSFHNPAPGEDRYQSLERRAEDVADRGLQWLKHNHDGPFFMWLHFFDPHDPYDPPEPFKSKYAAAPYDGEIAYTDSIVGSVMDVLNRHGLYEDTLIAIAADHGEAFGEHHERRHGLLLYDETIHVPLLLKLPGGKFAGTRIDARVALADLAPSLMEAAGIAIPAAVQAQSLFPLIETPKSNDKAKDSSRAIYSETDYAHQTLGWSDLRSWRGGKYLYIQAPTKELYDDSVDPLAGKNLALSSRAVAQTMDAQLSEFLKKTARGDPQKHRIDAAQVANLGALGYLASAEVVSKTQETSKVNPRDKVETVNRLQDALADVEAEKYQQALKKLQLVIRDPDAARAYLEFGIAMARHSQYKEAIPLLRTASRKIPDSVVAHFELAKALVNTGQWQAALPEMQVASDLKPDSATLHFYVASVHGNLRQIPEAIAEYKKALAVDPDFFDANLTYGRLLLQLQRPQEALPLLKHAVEVRPDSAQAHRFLADAYDKLGQAAEAYRERSAAENAPR
jgi:arylsulfatase A-like enzyme/Tfp pilus assembly protein PilF